MLRYRLPEVGAGRDCGRDGWGPSRCCWFCWSIVQGKCPGLDGKGAPMIFAAVFTVRCRVLQSAALQFPYQTVMQLVSTLSMVPL